MAAFEMVFKPGKYKPVLYFFFVLFFFQCIIKLVFYNYNAPLLSGSSTGQQGIFSILKWSFLYDGLTLVFINAPFIIFLSVAYFFKLKNTAVKIIAGVFVVLNLLCILLNVADIFYFHFNFHRADAGIFYVLQHPFQKAFIASWGLSIFAFFFILAIILVLAAIFWKLIDKYKSGNTFYSSSIVLAFILMILAILPVGKKILLPTYPLVQLNSSQLQLVQNSFHTVLYSLYRKHEGAVKSFHYMPDAVAASLVSFNKKITVTDENIPKKNVVLFIMESVPEDFFNAANKYKVAMPFLDSLVSKSTYFPQAYSYSYTSNNGITSILSGLPTLTEIPLYHSSFVNLAATGVGTELHKQGYQSSFFIGDSYDDFGFAKCCNWLGIDKYYSKESIPGYQNMQSHTMGLQDEYVLPFMLSEINKMNSPFFSALYNISTHYPYDIPKNFTDKNSIANFTLPMKSMAYYSDCLQHFFAAASKEAWYQNTVFIFCADHWMLPDDKIIAVDDIQGFHIPLFIFDPGNPQQKIINKPVCQFDIINTILRLGKVRDSIISYGEDLLAAEPEKQRYIFCKKNTGTYIVIDSSYALGFNPVSDKAEFCFNFKKDSARKNNLLHQPTSGEEIKRLLREIKAFQQQSSRHYNKLTDR